MSLTSWFDWFRFRLRPARTSRPRAVSIPPEPAQSVDTAAQDTIQDRLLHGLTNEQVEAVIAAAKFVATCNGWEFEPDWIVPDGHLPST
ncbi:hypothetical protein SAMN05444166_0144 [Singulisphaera sp. GP187]|uniref:hypothetical protein n=1 Tax=Singulisphaera sp. GP187 TaxID=1882752 RepID=UPI00092BA96D|nr:hypothetical protein [Singulisphaera sp. GP187]SIN69052.1 hypothetical protein SAMN05444166_0144 [Singulisphaera sp. GP187]